MRRRPVTLFMSLALCGAAAWTGDRLGSGSSRPDENPATLRAVAPAKPKGSAAGAAAEDDVYSLEQRRALAACDSGALWNWLKTTESRYYPNTLIAAELLDRFGVEALATAFAIPDPEVRGRVAADLLAELVKRDPAAALEIFAKHEGELPAGDVYVFRSTLAAAACTMSADRLIATWEALHEGPPPSPDQVDCPPGFDFRKVMDHMATGEKGLPALAPQLLREWGRSAPAAAAQWLAAHAPEGPWSQGTLDDPGDPVTVLISTIATSGQPERHEAFATLMQLPEEIRKGAWQSLKEGALDRPLQPDLLEAATAMGERDGYLKNALLSTRFLDEPDPAWAQVPPEERAGLLAWEAARWAQETQEKAPPPVAEKIRAHWRARLEAEWRELKK